MSCQAAIVSYDAPRIALQGKPGTMPVTTLPSWLHRLLLLCLCGLAGCGSFEEKRIRELLHEKGFGARADGDATRENYVGGRDRIQFLLSPETIATPGYERLSELTVPQPVAIDGTIHVPYVGPVYVLGHTEAQLSALVAAQLRAKLKNPIQLQARIVVSLKYFYAIGETEVKGRVPMEPDLTLWDAVFITRWTALANLGRVYLIRPDAETPLVVDVNFREMLTTGNTTANIPIREHDLIYIPPTFLGMIARLLQRLLQPVGLAVSTVFGVAQIRTAYEVATGQQTGLYFRF